MALGGGGSGIEPIGGRIFGHGHHEIFAAGGGNHQGIDGGTGGAKGALGAIGHLNIGGIKAGDVFTEGKGGGLIGGGVVAVREPGNGHGGGGGIPGGDLGDGTDGPSVESVGRYIGYNSHHQVHALGGGNVKGIGLATAGEGCVFFLRRR